MKKRLPPRWREKIESTFDKKDCMFSLQFKDDQVPEGFEQVIGEIKLRKKPPHLVERADLFDDRFKNKKLGLQLYILALKELGMISTDYDNATDEAKRVWRSLFRKYESPTTFFDEDLTIINKKRKVELKKKRKITR